MKSFFLTVTAATIAVVILMSFNVKTNDNYKRETKFKRQAILTKSDTDITLNGIGKKVADTMRKHFSHYRGQDTKPIRESVWFDSASFRHMVNILLKERGLNHHGFETSDSGQTDGLRIYFVSDISITHGQLNNSIVLVSTKKTGYSDSVPSLSTHGDYYPHSNDPWFKNGGAIHGVVQKRPWFIFNFRGERLYNMRLRFLMSDKDTCDNDLIHYTTRGKANKMANQFGHDTIRTISEWFDIGLLNSFAKDTLHDGVRIYFVRHPDNYKGKSDKDIRKEAFFIVATKASHKIHVDDFNCRTTTSFFTLYKKRLEKMPKKQRDKLLHDKTLYSGNGGDDNGELCPYNCN